MFIFWSFIPGCGGNLADVNGTFASPGYPGTPAENKTCIWRIKVTHLIVNKILNHNRGQPSDKNT